MWDWHKGYPWVRVEDIGSPYEPKEELCHPAEYDYIIVGGSRPSPTMLQLGDGTDLQGALPDVCLQTD
jgi:hypothetical protein